MSSIHIYPSPQRDWNSGKREVVPAEPSSRRQGQPSPEQGMMYPWSIGTTKVAQEHPEVSRPQVDCPPEVYIG